MAQGMRRLGRGSTTPTIEILGIVERIASLEKEVERLHAIEGPTSRVGFSVILSGPMTDIVASADQTVLFDTERFDIGGNFNVGTYTFTAPFDGKYLLIFHTRLQDADSAATWARCQIITSNRTYVQYAPIDQMTADSDYVGVEVCAIADMDATDTAYCTVRQQGGANQMDVTSGTNSRFMGWLIG